MAELRTGTTIGGFVALHLGLTDISLPGTLATVGAITSGGVVLGPSGAVGAPAFAFSSDLTTGMYRVGANQIGFATGGILRLSIGTSGLSMATGTTLAAQALTVANGLAVTEGGVLHTGTYMLRTENTGNNPASGGSGVGVELQGRYNPGSGLGGRLLAFDRTVVDYAPLYIDASSVYVRSNITMGTGTVLAAQAITGTTVSATKFVSPSAGSGNVIVAAAAGWSHFVEIGGVNLLTLNANAAAFAVPTLALTTPAGNADLTIRTDAAGAGARVIFYRGATPAWYTGLGAWTGGDGYEIANSSGPRLTIGATGAVTVTDSITAAGMLLPAGFTTFLGATTRSIGSDGSDVRYMWYNVPTGGKHWFGVNANYSAVIDAAGLTMAGGTTLAAQAITGTTLTLTGGVVADTFTSRTPGNNIDIGPVSGVSARSNIIARGTDAGGTAVSYYVGVNPYGTDGSFELFVGGIAKGLRVTPSGAVLVTNALGVGFPTASGVFNSAVTLTPSTPGAVLWQIGHNGYNDFALKSSSLATPSLTINGDTGAARFTGTLDVATGMLLGAWRLMEFDVSNAITLGGHASGQFTGVKLLASGSVVVTVNSTGLSMATGTTLAAQALTASNIYSSGNLTVASGGASITGRLLVTGPTNDWSLAVNGSGVASQSFGLSITAGTSSADYAMFVRNAAATSSYFYIRGDGLAYFYGNVEVGGTTTLQALTAASITATGSFTTTATDAVFVAQAATTARRYMYIANNSGAALLGVEGSVGGGFISGTAAYQTVLRFGAGGLALGADAGGILASFSSSGLTLTTGATFTGGTPGTGKVQVGSDGGGGYLQSYDFPGAAGYQPLRLLGSSVTLRNGTVVFATFEAVGATFYGSASSWTTNTVGSTTTGTSLGALISAGTNASDYALYVRNAAASSVFMYIRGDGLVYVTNNLEVAGTATLQTLTATLKSYKETLTAPTISSNTLTLDCSAGNVFRVSLNANVSTWTFQNVPASGTAFSLTVVLDVTGSFTITWPASFKWLGQAGSPNTTNGKVDMLNLVTTDGGTTWLASYAKGA